MQPDPPFVDRHELRVPSPAPQVWRALLTHVERSLAAPGPLPKRVLARLLGTDPRPGFDPVVSEPGRVLRLVGRHRFSRYVLVLEVEPDGDHSVLAAVTYAEFPGLHGQVYETLVMRSRLHVVATRALLRAVSRRR